MSEFGIKIKNIEAGSIYGCNIGIREKLDTEDAMLSNSLFTDYLLKKCRIPLYKNVSTRSVITILFNYGSPSFDEEIQRQEKKIKELKKNEDISEKEKNSRIENLNKHMSRAYELKDRYCKKSKEELREMFYRDGVSITYNSYKKDGSIKKSETIKYRMLSRTPGKAKKGTCLFIDEKFYEKARNFLYMGIKLPEDNAKIVEIGAYSSLSTSSIVSRLRIKPNEILVLKDVSSFFKTNVTSVELNEKKECIAVRKENYEVENILFDGQALIDTSIFPEWADGFVVLRHHFFKCAAFHSNLQLFFRDYYEDKYWNATVKDMFGNKRLVRNIKLITTDNALKFLKFDGITFDYWIDQIKKNGFQFGVVKTGHESKFGEVQRMSYQMVNALNINTMPEVLSDSIAYIVKLKNNDEEFLNYLRKNANFSNDYQVLLALCEQNPTFINCDYFRERRTDIIYSYTKEIKVGHVIQNADNLVIVGNPYGMLLHSVGEDALSDPTFEHEDGCIQCYTGRFADGEYLAEFRSPFNSRNSLGYCHNKYHPYWDKYFDLGRQIIAINMINTDFQDMNNGLTYWVSVQKCA